MFCGYCGAAVHDSHRFCPACGRPVAAPGSDRSERSIGSAGQANSRAINALIDAAVSYEKLAMETGNTEKYLPLAKGEYDKALSTLTEDSDPELFCTVSYYLARLWMYAESEGLDDLGSVPIFEARSLLEEILPLAERIHHSHYSEFRELYRQCIPGRLGG